jgi:uncharacterized membrane protein (DUF4010 family)
MQPVFQQLGIALALGLLVGLQREFVGKSMAGLRTFPLVTVFGTLVALIDQQVQAGGWIVAAGLLSVVALAVVANVIALHNAEETPGPGVTTEAAMFVMFGVGAFLTSGQYVVAVAIGAGVAVLLQFKPELHGIVDRLGEKDLRAIMQFAVISAIVLPLLPAEPIAKPQTITLGGVEIAIPLDTFVPREVWWMVVLIVGISLGGYLAYKFFGRHAGILLGGLMGGAVSSTATTVSYSRRTAQTPQLARIAAVVIMIASSIVYVRVLVEIAVVAPTHFVALAPPVVVVLLGSLLAALVLWLFVRQSNQEEMPEPKNPTELKSALMFAVMYAVVLFALAAVKRSEFFASSGLYVVAALSGLTDMDAITLSTARMVTGQDGGIDAYQGWRLILLAGISNLVFKAGMVSTLGSWRLLAWIAPLFAVPVAISLLLIFLWPATWTLGQ